MALKRGFINIYLPTEGRTPSNVLSTLQSSGHYKDTPFRPGDLKQILDRRKHALETIGPNLFQAFVSIAGEVGSSKVTHPLAANGVPQESVEYDGLDLCRSFMWGHRITIFYDQLTQGKSFELLWIVRQLFSVNLYFGLSSPSLGIFSVNKALGVWWAAHAPYLGLPSRPSFANCSHGFSFRCDPVVTVEKKGILGDPRNLLNPCNIWLRMVGDERLELPTSSV
jgi:hypothetical protein